MGKNVTEFFVTGSSGFLGREFVRQLVMSGKQVTGADLVPLALPPRGLEFLELDLTSNFVVSPDFIEANIGNKFIHCAAISDIYEAQQSLENTLKTNFVGTQKLATYFLDNHADDADAIFVYASSVYAVENAMNFYGLSKYLAEQYLTMIFRNVSAKCMIVKFGSLYGTNSGPNNGIRKMVETAITSGQVVYGGYEDAVRDYLHVEDAARLTLSEISNFTALKSKCLSVVMTGGYPRPIREVAELISRLCQCQDQPVFEGAENILNYREGSPRLDSTVEKHLIPGSLDMFEQRLTELVLNFSKGA